MRWVLALELLHRKSTDEACSHEPLVEWGTACLQGTCILVRDQDATLNWNEHLGGTSMENREQTRGQHRNLSLAEWSIVLPQTSWSSQSGCECESL